MSECVWQDASSGFFLVGLSYIPWREAWKYGVRAFRYCQLDLGHAAAALRYAAATLGWQAQLLLEPGDEEVARLLGLDRKQDFEAVEKEFIGMLLAVGSGVGGMEDEPMRLLDGMQWQGRASRLSAHEIEWTPITEVIGHSRKPLTKPAAAPIRASTKCDQGRHAHPPAPKRPSL